MTLVMIEVTWELSVSKVNNMQAIWGEIMMWCEGIVVITTAQLHSTKPKLRFCTGSNPACSVSEIHNGEDLWLWSRLKIRLNAFHQSTIPQKQFIIIIIIINIAEMMCKLVNQQSASEIDVWWKPNGVSLFYGCLWWSGQKENEDPWGKLTHLIKYTTGEVKEMAKNCIQLPPRERYETAKQMMSNLHGDPHWVIAAYHKESKQWHRSNQEIMKHIEIFITSYLNVGILHKCRHGMF